MYPLVIAAHPSEPNQFALGLTDGGVHILEPLESEGKWGTSPPTENGAGPSTTSGAAGSDQPQRWQLNVHAFDGGPWVYVFLPCDPSPWSGIFWNLIIMGGSCGI